MTGLLCLLALAKTGVNGTPLSRCRRQRAPGVVRWVASQGCPQTDSVSGMPVSGHPRLRDALRRRLKDALRRMPACLRHKQAASTRTVLGSVHEQLRRIRESER